LKRSAARSPCTASPPRAHRSRSSCHLARASERRADRHDRRAQKEPSDDPSEFADRGSSTGGCRPIARCSAARAGAPWGERARRRAAARKSSTTSTSRSTRLTRSEYPTVRSSSVRTCWKASSRRTRLAPVSSQRRRTAGLCRATAPPTSFTSAAAPSGRTEPPLPRRTLSGAIGVCSARRRARGTPR
jgi:hypothetical protein